MEALRRICPHRKRQHWQKRFIRCLFPAKSSLISDVSGDQAVLVSPPPTQHHLSSDLWIRLYAHALLRESRIFPNVELCDESPDYAPTGLTDIWKGDRYGELVCIKTIRTRHPVNLREITSVGGSFTSLGARSVRFMQTFRRMVGRDPHPNVLPVIGVSETLFPLCIMSPWMPDGNITQYTQTNPGADPLILVRVHRPDDLWTTY